MTPPRNAKPGQPTEAHDNGGAGGALLIGLSVAAMLLVNAVPGGAHLYHHLLDMPIGPELAPGLGRTTPHLVVNDALMAIFFLLVGLEIKREWVSGSLAGWDQRTLPFVAATAGMAVPALLYLAIAGGTAGLKAGWAIPAATDIAFALGVLAVLGSRVPVALKLLLTTIAVVDDMGAIAIIAVAYTSSLNWIALGAAAGIVAVMAAMNRAGVLSQKPHLIAFALLWYAVLLSGVHATLAGVIAAMTVPAKGGEDSVLHRMENSLHPWSTLFVLPLFGFANAGIEIPLDLIAALLSPLPLGIAAGLFVGKQVGIFGAIRLAVEAGLAQRPAGTTWRQLHGMATLCGIGFTMSLFIGSLAFPGHPALVEEAKVGVLAGSLLSALFGLLLLRLAPRAPEGAR